MNWKPKLNTSLLLLFGVVIVFSAIIFFNSPRNQEITKSTEKESKDLRDLEYEEVSPDGLNKVILYNFSFDSSIFRDYYKDYFDNDTVVSVRDIENETERYIFTGSRIGLPKWIGNEYVFFTSYCGSGCQGIYLVNVFNKETRQGVLGYTAREGNKTQTYFTDWFDHDFKFEGWVDEIRSDTISNKTYLIFYMRDDNKKVIGQKRFLFTGEALKE